MLAGLSALAITQPVLDLFGQNPQFFVAGNYASGQIALFALVVAIVPPLVGWLLTAVATLVTRRAGTVVFGVVAGLFGAAFLLAFLRSRKVDAFALVTLLAVAAAVLVGVLVVKARPAQLFTSYLSVANVGFVALFLFASPAADLVTGGGTAGIGDVDVPPLTAPVVLIILDEMPTATFMRAGGTINEERYPGFAELASVSTWFRNASSQYNLTHRSVPQILTGELGDDEDLPTYDDHPRNLFTLLGQDVPVTRYESVTDMCPSEICAPPPRQPLAQALEDASIVYGHRVLPSSLRDELPPIDISWGAFSGDKAAADPNDPFAVAEAAGTEDNNGTAYAKWLSLDADQRSPRGQAALLQEQIDSITGEPALYFAHVALPHRPWVLSRSGIATSFSPELITDPAAPGYAFGQQLDYQLHSMQLGAADRLIGELVDRLQSLPSWRDTMIVVTSDHGTNLTPPDIGRMRVTDANREEVYRIPLFIKAPGQTTGDLRDEPASTIDVLPSMVDLLDVTLDESWTFDGHSLFDGSEATVAPKVSADVQEVIDIAARRAEQFHYGDDWVSLAGVGVNGDLVGREVRDLDVGAPSEYRVTLTQADLFADLPTAEATAPFVLDGRVDAQDGTAAPEAELVAAINGRIAGVLGGYRPSGDGWALDGWVADLYVDGANDVAVYEVERTGDSVVLRPAG